MRSHWTVAFVIVMAALAVQATPSDPSSGVKHYTTHATGDFNHDGRSDMILTHSYGRATLLLGTDTGYTWCELSESDGAAAAQPDKWPAGSYLLVRAADDTLEVFTRDVRGTVHRYSTTVSPEPSKKF